MDKQAALATKAERPSQTTMLTTDATLKTQLNKNGFSSQTSVTEDTTSEPDTDGSVSSEELGGATKNNRLHKLLPGPLRHGRYAAVNDSIHEALIQRNTILKDKMATVEEENLELNDHMMKIRSENQKLRQQNNLLKTRFHILAEMIDADNPCKEICKDMETCPHVPLCSVAFSIRDILRDCSNVA